MLKHEFQEAVRERLRKVPLDTRKTWSENQLFIWWLEAKSQDSYLVWDRCPSDLWQSVKGMCHDLIGPNAY